MIKFFRKVRKQLLTDSSFSKYLIYAAGEITLVVIGILIALQVNTWNQHRINRNVEKLLLSEIHTEFIYNKAEFEANLSKYRSVSNSLFKIKLLFPIDVQTVNLDTLALLLEESHFVGNYDYSNISLEKIRNTSSFDIISNKELRNLLLQWEVVLLDYKEAEIRAIDYHENWYNPTLSKNLLRPYRTGLKDSRTDLDYLRSIEFENVIKSRSSRINNLFRLVEKTEDTKTIEEIIDRIIALSSQSNE